MLSLPGFEEFVSQDDLDVFDNGRYDEIVQMLSDLGYLSISAEEGKILYAGELEAGVLSFRREAMSGLLIGKASLLLPFPVDPQKNHEGILTYREFSVLQLLVSFDGDFTLKPLSEIRNSGIYTRVIQYRLHLMGLHKRHPDGIYTDEINLALDQLAGWLSPVKPDELLDLTGNISKLVFRLKASPAFRNKIIYFNSELEAFGHFYGIFGSNTGFIDQLEKDIDSKSQEYRQLIKMAKQPEIDRQFFSVLTGDDFSDFIIRISQLSQWISGYYIGRIDGEIGDCTFESFRQLAQSEVEHGNSDFEMGKLVGNISNEYWVVNPHYLFQEISVPETEPDIQISKVFSSYNDQYELLDDSEKSTVDSNMKLAWKSINIDQNCNMKSSADRFRRIYFGARSLLRSFWKGMKNIFNRLKESVIDFASGFFNVIKNFAKYLYREIREALQVFSRGLNFLFGKRELATGDCTAKFDFDMDCITCFSCLLNDKSIGDYQQLLVANTTGLLFCMKLTGRVIHLLIHAGLGWQSLIIQAGILLKQLVKECYSNKEYADFVVDPRI